MDNASAAVSANLVRLASIIAVLSRSIHQAMKLPRHFEDQRDKKSVDHIPPFTKPFATLIHPTPCPANLANCEWVQANSQGVDRQSERAISAISLNLYHSETHCLDTTDNLLKPAPGAPISIVAGVAAQSERLFVGR